VSGPKRRGGKPPPKGRKPKPSGAPRVKQGLTPLRATGSDPVSSGRVLYGRNPVEEALRAGRRTVHEVWATAAAAREPWLTSLGPRIVDADDITARSGTDAHQGVCARVDPYPYADAARLLAVEHPLVVALDEIQDPQNLGAIARTVECAGATGLVIPERRSAEVTPAAAKASAGAVEHLPIARVRNLADFLAEAKERSCWVYGADGSAAGAMPYDRAGFEGAVVLVLGAEGRGLRPRVRASCDVLVSIPLHGRIESLNVSVAAGILLYESLRNRRSETASDGGS
jgi:23S rRNA (guanosine2251-2'-O)-methyltransferase